MTAEQYERWQDFARRMVNIVRGPRHRSPSRADVLEVIDFFFECRMEPCDEWKRVVDWDHTEKKPDSNHWPMCAGDHIRDIAEYHIPNYWSLDDDKYEAACDRWMDPPSACLRAGLDIASSPSAGVIGFTAGDIRKMYPEGVPQWVKDFFPAGQEMMETDKVVPGIGFTMKKSRKKSKAFDQIPDDAEVWL